MKDMVSAVLEFWSFFIFLTAQGKSFILFLSSLTVSMSSLLDHNPARTAAVVGGGLIGCLQRSTCRRSTGSR